MNHHLNDNPLYCYFINNKKNQIDKWVNYFSIYHRYLEKFRNTPVVFVEVGVQNGGSLQMWRDYFGVDARIIGIDIDQRCKVMEEEGFEIWIGDQQDPTFWKSFRENVRRIDVLLDDGGHTMQQQLVTFREMFPMISVQGCYLCEDLHTSYSEFHNGGYLKKGTFIEHVKDLIDEMHAWHFQDSDVLNKTSYKDSLRGMHIFESIIVFEKGNNLQPIRKVVGNPVIVDNVSADDAIVNLHSKQQFILKRLFNRFIMNSLKKGLSF